MLSADEPALPPPYLTGRGRVYASVDVRRARRRELLVRWLAGPVLALAAVMVCAGFVDQAVVWALAGLTLAAVVLGMAWAVGRP